jgi:phenylacetate-coenzyme A ligase PaaK-like adenylate-forming protein
VAFQSGNRVPFWLDFAAKLGWDPRREIRSFEDLKRFPPFEDEWLRGGPLQRWLPKGLAGKPLYVFETGGTTGIPKSRLAIEDFPY